MGRERQWREWTDDELVREGFNVDAEASVEMMRRLKRSNEILATVNIVLTAILTVLTAVLVFAAFHFRSS